MFGRDEVLSHNKVKCRLTSHFYIVNREPFFGYIVFLFVCLCVSSYFIKVILEKKYALAYGAVDAVTAHFLRFLEEKRVMPVIWHQTLLAFVQR